MNSRRQLPIASRKGAPEGFVRSEGAHPLSLEADWIFARLGWVAVSVNQSVAEQEYLPTIAELLADGNRPTFSFELFPPTDDDAEDVLWRTIRDLEATGPDWLSVTYGAQAPPVTGRSGRPGSSSTAPRPGRWPT